MKWFREKSYTHLLFSQGFFEYVIETHSFNIFFIIVMSLILDTTCFKIFVENDFPMAEQIKMDNMDNKGFKPILCC